MREAGMDLYSTKNNSHESNEEFNAVSCMELDEMGA